MRIRRKICIALIFLFGIFILSLLLGNGAIGTKDILRVLLGGGTDSGRVIVFKVRLPRILSASLCGAALSVSGLLLQSSLDNRIASPGILGINNGAGLFVLLSALLFPMQSGIKCIMAFLGAALVTLFISLLSAKTGMSKTSVILSGVAVSALFLALIDLIISLKPETVADKTAFQIGGFQAANLSSLLFSLPFIAAGIFLSLIISPSLDILKLGDETAEGLGLNAKGIRNLSVICAALLSGAAISIAGILGFVGLIIPNCIRMTGNENSRNECILSAIWGGTFLLFCDTVSRQIVFPYELPCGLILNFIGAPFLIWILIKKRKRLGTD